MSNFPSEGTRGQTQTKLLHMNTKEPCDTVVPKLVDEDKDAQNNKKGDGSNEDHIRKSDKSDE